MKSTHRAIILIAITAIIASISVASCMHRHAKSEELEEPTEVAQDVEDELEQEPEPEPEPQPEVEPEGVEPITDPEPVDLELLAGAIPDEYLENPEEQYAEPVDEAVEEIYESTEGGLLEDGLGADEEGYYSAYTPYDLMYHGVIYWGGWRWTWYSEKVLPGGGLNIPGRWSDGDFVRDGDGYICLASSDLLWGSYVDTPWGPGRVYDSGCASGTLDVYVSW